jgi:DNA-binding transcriptional regulator YdaS (Cro superfamily)
MNLSDYLNKEGSGSIRKLAKSLGVPPSSVSFWKANDRKTPVLHCIEIEKLTKGEVRCEELRPDIDWGYLRNHK